MDVWKPVQFSRDDLKMTWEIREIWNVVLYFLRLVFLLHIQDKENHKVEREQISKKTGKVSLRKKLQIILRPFGRFFLCLL